MNKWKQFWTLDFVTNKIPLRSKSYSDINDEENSLSEVECDSEPDKGEPKISGKKIVNLTRKQVTSAMERELKFSFTRREKLSV